MAKEETIIMTGYYRVSTKKEAQQSSFKNQPAYFRTLLKRPEFKHYKACDKFYCDYGVSGTKLNRPGFKEMLEDAGLDVEIEDRADIPHPKYPDKMMKQRIYKVSVNPKKKPKFNEIWIRSTSRLARNINAYQILETLRLAKVYVFFIDRDLSTRYPEDMPAIRKCLDEDMAYSEGLSRSRDIVNQIYRDENRISGPLFGFDYHKKTKERNPYYTINPIDSKIVDKVFDYCIEGLGSEATSQRLKAEGMKSSDGRFITARKVTSILNNEKYCGLNTVGKYTTGTIFEKLPFAQVTADYESRLKEHPDIPAIISVEKFRLAKEARKKRRTNPENNSSKGKGIVHNPFKDFLVCQYCGNHFVYDHNGGRGFFKCSTKATRGVVACNCNNLFNYKLEEHITKLQKTDLHWLIELDFQSTIITLITFLEAYLEKMRNPNGDEEVQKRLAEIGVLLQNKKGLKDGLLSQLQNDFSADTLTAFTAKITDLEAEIKCLEQEQTVLTTPTFELYQKIDELFATINEELNLCLNIKQTYTRQEVFDLLSELRVAGKTINNTGGRPPEPIIMPVLKPTAKASALIKMGYEDFSYKFREGIPNYEAPASFIQTKRKTIPLPEVHPFDRDDLTIEDKKESISKTTKKDWPTSTSPHCYTSNAFGVDGYIKDLGIESKSVNQQIKDYVDELYQQYLIYLKEREQA